ncbi:MAG: indolepyruvate ferredoxin oxidoreductase subunit alpha [Candidatus Staskawiczbacteria bacterium]|nr:indolepyruvate ferredoxin oxidoreductase subunit alpha [Candidatus Staskawiczbacteria bacterium]
MKKILLGNEAIVKGALVSGVSFVSGYPGCPSAEIGDEFGKIAEKNGVYAEWSTNEKVALEAAIGASFSGLKSLVNMKSFGINVCSDSLLPLAYTGTKAPMVIVVADDPSCWSSAQTEQNSRAYAYLSHIPMLEPADPQECYDFTKLGFEISEKFNTPVILRTTTRVNHQKMIVDFEEPHSAKATRGDFVKNPKQFCTMPPRVLEMKAELLEKTEKISAFAEKSSVLNKVSGRRTSPQLGIITSGVAHLHTLEALDEMQLSAPVLKLGLFYPLTEKKIAKFIKGLKKVLIVEELDGYLEKEIKAIAKEANPKLQIFGKDLLPVIGELDTGKIELALSKITGKKFTLSKESASIAKAPRRYPKLCQGCPHLYTIAALKRIAPNAVFGGDIGCYMIAGYPPHNTQDYEFAMGAGLGISHGVSKATGQKVISLMGDGTFFHAGIPALINTVYNKSSPILIVLDNRITAMTGHQNNPGMGKNLMGKDAEELQIADIAKACGVKNVKVLDPSNIKELDATIKEFLEKDEVSVIVCKLICALLARRQQAAKE